MKRECGTCTKCCEGWLNGEALGHKFYLGRPCHFVAIGKGCTAYAKRPKEPCVVYKCAWLSDERIPEWFKPNDINAIIDWHKVENITYLRINETGSRLDSRVLSWAIQFALNNKINLYWKIDGGENWFGESEFVEAMNRLQLLPNNK